MVRRYYPTNNFIYRPRDPQFLKREFIDAGIVLALFIATILFDL